jgi:hypothetical protein
MRLPTDGEGLSSIEKEFFRAGDEMNANEVSDSELESEVVAPPQRRAWSRWFGRTSRPATEPGIAENENRDRAADV